MIKLVYFLLVFLASVSAAIGDSPLPALADYTVTSHNSKFEAFIELQPPRTTVFNVSGVQRMQLWSKPGFHRTAFLADDGQHFVACYGGANLIPRYDSRDLVLLEFFDGPISVRSVSVAEIIPDAAKLQETASHYHWGQFLGFDSEGHFVIETVDFRRIAFDVTSGRVVSTNLPPEK